MIDQTHALLAAVQPVRVARVVDGIRHRALNLLRQLLLQLLGHDAAVLRVDRVRLVRRLGVARLARGAAGRVDLVVWSVGCLTCGWMRSGGRTESGSFSSRPWGAARWMPAGTFESPVACDAPWPCWLVWFMAAESMPVAAAFMPVVVFASAEFIMSCYGSLC